MSTTSETAMVVKYRNEEIAHIGRHESWTYVCAGNFMRDNVSVTFNSDGYLSYYGLTTVVCGGKSYTLMCKNKRAEDNIIFVADTYSTDSPLPPNINSEEGMKDILENATSESVGAIYKYKGETTDTYESDALYIVAEE